MEAVGGILHTPSIHTEHVLKDILVFGRIEIGSQLTEQLPALFHKLHRIDGYPIFLDFEIQIRTFYTVILCRFA